MCLNTKKLKKIKIKAGQYMWNERFNKEFKEESKKETNEKSKNELKKELFGDEFYEEMEPEKRLEIFQKNIESDNNKELREC